MKRKPLDQLGELQRAVLEAVWELEGGTVQQVMDKLKPDRTPAYTTVLTTLQNLTKSGWIEPEKSGRAFTYYASRSKTQANAGSLSSFIRRAFDGNTKAMLQTLLDGEEFTEAELDELRELIEQKKREEKKR